MLGFEVFLKSVQLILICLIGNMSRLVPMDFIKVINYLNVGIWEMPGMWNKLKNTK